MLLHEEIRFFVPGSAGGELPDYQIAALAMATYFRGMNFDETLWLARAMVQSGKIVEWKRGASSYTDKHGPSGISDKVSLILEPLVACRGVRVPMISGRNLGPTGVPLDKFESTRGFAPISHWRN